ncbi:aminotransferase class V-fold PLP-dependent enzyme [Nonomuraea sp. NPDC049480]|uniref:aminotransferase class V-fold PLP-dependent enzyme n=1 Tax=Nonomuraea sp. NPDC049480 TaxID=3364353 RepID=UPI0037B90461
MSITHIPTNDGLVNPAAEVGKIAAEAGVLFLLDACQSVDRIPSTSSRSAATCCPRRDAKFSGPRGTGLLYVRRAVLGQLDPPLLDLRSAQSTAPDRFEIQPGARRFENGEYRDLPELVRASVRHHNSEEELILLRDELSGITREGIG